MALYILFGVTLVLLSISYIISKRDLIAPSVVVCSVFCISEFFAILNIDKWNINYSYEATGLLLLGIIVFIVTSQVSKQFFAKRSIKVFHFKNYKNTQYASELIIIKRPVLIICCVFCVLIIPIYYISLVRLAASTGLQGALTVVMKNITYMDGRTTDMTQGTLPQMLARLCLILSYIFTFVFINNRQTLKAANVKGPRFYSYLIPTICYFLASMFDGSRIQYLLYAAYFFTLSFYMAQKKAKTPRRITRKYIRIAVIAVIVILCLFYAVLGLLGRDYASLNMLDYLSIYVGGSIQHFNQFVQDPIMQSNVWGRECFYSIYNFLWGLGLYPDHISPHLEFRLLYKIGNSGLMNYSGNVYTFFRSPLSDFGVWGMCITTAIVSVFYSIFYYNSIKKKKCSYPLLIVYAYLYAQLFMISIANQITIMISVYGFINVTMLYLVTRIMLRYSYRVQLTEVESLQVKRKLDTVLCVSQSTNARK